MEKVRRARVVEHNLYNKLFFEVMIRSTFSKILYQRDVGPALPNVKV